MNIGTLNKSNICDDPNIYSTYTPTDFDRWDSYEPKYMAYCPLKKNNLTSFKSAYLIEMKNKFLLNYFTVSQNWFIGYLNGTNMQYDMINVLRSNQLNSTDILLFVGHAINSCYNQYRNTVIANKTNMDTIIDIDWMSLPNMPGIAQYIETWILTFFSTQSFKHNTVETGRGCFDTYGVFALSGSFKGNLDPNYHFWYVSTYAVVCCHYSHLLTSKTLRYLRTGFMASLSALYGWLQITGIGLQLSTAQWLTRISGWTMSCTFLIQSENLLKSRKDWTDNLDTITNSDRLNGKWTVFDSLEFCVVLLNNYVDYTNKYGISEYASSYYGFSLDNVNMCLIHSPNKQVYDLWNTIYKQFWYDIALNLFIPSSCLSAPTNRHYGLITQTNSTINRYDLQTNVEPLFSSNVIEFNSDNMDLNNLTFESLENKDIRILPMLMTLKQLGNYDFTTLETILSILCLQNSYRIACARFTSTVGQERYNFLTPFYQIGHSGNFAFDINVEMIFVARLAGKPISTNSGNNISLNCLPVIQIISTTNSNDLFSKKNGILLANDQTISRQVVSQYQSYALITQMLDSTHIDSTNSVGLANNILLPINIDSGIFINGVKMNTTYGTLYGIPCNSIISVHHQNSCICIKLLFIQSELRNVDRIQQVTDLTCMNLSKDNPSNQNYSVVYQIDKESFSYGCARIIITHRNKNSNTNNSPYYFSCLIAGGTTVNDSQRIALETVIKNSVYTQTISNCLPIKDSYTKTQTTLNCNVNIANSLMLAVDRTDCKTTNQNDLIFRDSVGSQNQYPYLFTALNRTVNKVDMFKFSDTDPSFMHTENMLRKDIFEPHLNNNTINLFPTYKSLKKYIN